MKHPVPANEVDRLAKVNEYDILDTPPEREYDDLVALAAEICQTPVAQISLIAADRQWYKAEYGFRVPGGQTPREDAFCAHTVMNPDRPLVIEDLRTDERFRDNRFVAGEPHVVFYAGFPLRSDDGYALGTLCVIDQQPRQITEAQRNTLARLSRQVVKLFELRRSLRNSQLRLQEKEAAYRLLSDFSHIIAHDLKAPVRNIRQAADMLEEECSQRLTPDDAELLGIIGRCADDATSMIDGVLRYSQATRSSRAAGGRVHLPSVIERASAQFGDRSDYRVQYTGAVEYLEASEVALSHIFQNLIGNAIKFSGRECCEVIVDARHDPGRGYTITVADNGPGIPQEALESVFRLFYSAVTDERRGHGVGLSIVRRLVEDLDGTVSVRSPEGSGAVFTIRIPELASGRESTRA